MMHELIRIADEITGGVRETLSHMRDHIRGVLLDVDDHWEFLELMHAMDSLPLHYPDNWLMDDFHALATRKRLLYDVTPNLSFRPPRWHEHCRNMGYPKDAKPFVIRVILKHDRRKKALDAPRSYMDYPIVYEVRRSNRALSFWSALGRLTELSQLRGESRLKKAPSIGRADPHTAGTLGGILAGREANRYLVTCGHVLGPPETHVYAPGPYEGKAFRPIGPVRHWTMPNAGTTSDPCSEQVTPGAARLDLAIAEIADAGAISEMGYISNPSSVMSIASMRKNQPISLIGKNDGHITAKLGALTLWDQIEFPDESGKRSTDKVMRCFGRIFEIKPPGRQYVVEHLVKPGDSGSWITFEADEDSTAWCGMVMSGDGPQAYACFAEYILEETRVCGVFAGGLGIVP